MVLSGICSLKELSMLILAVTIINCVTNIEISTVGMQKIMTIYISMYMHAITPVLTKYHSPTLLSSSFTDELTDAVRLCC